MKNKILLAIVVFLLFIAWSSDPTPVCTASGAQDFPVIVGDGSGGVIIAWIDIQDFGNDRDVYMQRLSASGAALWGVNGRAIYSGAKKQSVSHLVADGSGGALFAVSNDIYASISLYNGYVKRINRRGNVVWTSNMISDNMPSARSWRLVSDGSGGVFIFWRERYAGIFYGQHIDRNGNTMWAAGGIPVCDSADTSIPAVPDGQGGAYVAGLGWNPEINYYSPCLYRIDGSGSSLWGREGIMLTDHGYHSILHPAPGNGVYAAWTRWGDIRMQRFDSAGNSLWGVDGVLVYRTNSDYLDLKASNLITDKIGGLYLLIEGKFEDWITGDYMEYEASIQHIDSSCNTTWGIEGVSIVSDWRWFRNTVMTGDGSGNAIVLWAGESDYGTRLKAQKVDAAGAFHWSGNGLTVSDDRFDDRSSMQAIPDEAGGVIAVWVDGNISQRDIYAQDICAAGGIGACAVPFAVIEIIRSGGIAPATITFDGSGSFAPNGKVERWRWNLGDGATASTPKVTHTYEKPGTYDVTLRVQDDSGQWSKTVMKRIKVFSLDAVEAVFDFYTGPVKSKNRGYAIVRASLYDKPHSEEERPIPADLGLVFETDKGNWRGEATFYSGIYTRFLSAETEGTATISAVLEGEVLAIAEVTFAWLLPPAAVTVDLQANRSLFRGEYYAHISWSQNPEEVFIPAKYRVYRSVDGGAFELAAEVDASVFSYLDEHLPAGRQYAFAVSMVDDMGDESEMSTASALNGNPPPRLRQGNVLSSEIPGRVSCYGLASIFPQVKKEEKKGTGGDREK